ncbi:MAG: type II secretion system F family protein [Armatimonadota bacterium]
MPPEQSVTNTEIAAMCQQFASLTHAQLNILDIFEALREQTSNPLMREVIESVRGDVENGRTLATAFSRYPNVFSPFFISMVRQGELEGELDRAFSDLATHYSTRLEETPDTTRLGAPSYDWEAAARSFQWLFIWATALSAFCLLGAGLIWYATVLGAVQGHPLPNILIFVSGIMFLGVLVFSMGRKKR